MMSAEARIIALVVLSAHFAAALVCDTTADCPSGLYCRDARRDDQSCHLHRECVVYKEECAPCEGYTLSCFFDQCNSDTHFCSQALNPPRIADAQGVCAPNSCARACPENYEPLCGSNGETYGNTCSLEAVNCVREQCSLAPLTVSCNGECPCPTAPPTTVDPCAERVCRSAGELACDASYEPVCGSDGQTYSNSCQFDVDTCGKSECVTLSCEGECPCRTTPEPAPRSPCDNHVCDTDMCTLLYDPVCGSNGKTYGNPCVFESETCTSKKCITVQCQGECPCTSCPEDFVECTDSPLRVVHCPAGSSCIDDPRDHCDPSMGGQDCKSICAPVEKARKMCGGFAGFSCDSSDFTCLDDPFDDCDPAHGGADCAGLCVSCRAPGIIEPDVLVPHQSQNDDEFTTVETVSIAGGGLVALGLVLVGVHRLRLRRRVAELPGHTRLPSGSA